MHERAQLQGLMCVAQNLRVINVGRHLERFIFKLHIGWNLQILEWDKQGSGVTRQTVNMGGCHTLTSVTRGRH